MQLKENVETLVHKYKYSVHIILLIMKKRMMNHYNQKMTQWSSVYTGDYVMIWD